MEENKRISDLFEAARTEAPKTSFDEVKNHLIAASAVGSVGIVAKFMAASIKFKVIIMIGVFSVLTISGILITTQISGNHVIQTNSALKNEAKKDLNIEVKRENGIERTIIYDENDRVVQISVDSSNETSERAESLELKTNSPTRIKNGEMKSEIVEHSQQKRNYPAIAQDSSMKVFEITDKTTLNELEAIQAQADAAGLSFNYTARVKKDKLKRISLKMKINNGNSTWNSEISGTSSFRFTFGWWENESGQVRRFLTDKEANIGAHRTNSE